MKRMMFTSFILIFVVGCSLLSPVNLPEVKHYVINQLPKTVKTYSKSSKKSLYVLSPIVESGFNTRSIIYIEQPYRLQQYAGMAWTTLPSEMVRSVLANTLKKMNYFRAVIEQPAFAKARYQLSTRIMKFQHECYYGHNRVRVVIQVHVVDTHNSAVIASHVFQRTHTIKSEEKYQIVLAFNDIIAKMSKDIGVFVVRHV